MKRLKHLLGRGRKKKEQEERDIPEKVEGTELKKIPVTPSLFVVAIDFGTTYSGWASSFRSDYKSNPTTNITARTWLGSSIVTQKAPTAILIKPDGKTVDSFGYVAEDEYSRKCEDGSQGEWFFFKRFKMMLHREKGIRRDLLLEDYTGKKLSALTVFSLAIKYLKDDVLEGLNKKIDGMIVIEDIHWVLTVPAIWNDAAKQFMREAATKAGISNKALSICLEPEAASIYCCHLPVSKSSGSGAEAIASLSQFADGTHYIVLDAGGGTVDITVHEKAKNGHLKELYKANGGAWGGTKVDEEFVKFLINIVGVHVMTSLFKNHLDDYVELFRSFELKKQTESRLKRDTTLRLPQTLFELCNSLEKKTLHDLLKESRYNNQASIKSDKIIIKFEVLEEFFEPAINNIIKHVDSLLKKKQLRKCSAILMVGGFSTSQLLQERVKQSFPNHTIVIPDSADIAVLKGAVIFGHKPRTILTRVCKFTYGTNATHKSRETCSHKGQMRRDEDGNMRCYDIFDIHAKIGQPVSLDEETEERIYNPVFADQSAISFQIYASSSVDPELVTRESCMQIGELTIPILDTSLGLHREFGVSFIFGGTEIRVKVTDKIKRQVDFFTANFLG